MHLGAGVIKGRDAQKYILMGLAVVMLLCQAGGIKGPVIMEDGLGESGGAGGEVNSRQVLLLQADGRRLQRAVAHQLLIAFREGGNLFAYIEADTDLVQGGENGLQPVHKLRTEHKGFHIRQTQAILDLLGRITEVERYCQTSRLENAEIDGQPFQTVHQQNSYLGTFFQPPAQQQIGETVGFFIKLAPGHFPAIGGVGTGALNETELPPGHRLVPLVRGVDFHQSRFIPIQPGIALQKVCNDHHPVSFASLDNKKTSSAI